MRETVLTASGQAAVERIIGYLDAHSPLVQRLDQAEREQLGALLRKLAGLPD